jgi:hypothetical protein
MWRPDGWREIKDKIYDKIALDDPYYSIEVYEAIEDGADAMLEALKKQGTYGLKLHCIPCFPGEKEATLYGWDVFIPDDEVK